MNILLIFPGFIIAFATILFYEHKIKLIKTRLICKEHNKNKVHFYVARDKNGKLWLYMGKPIRGDGIFYIDISKGSMGITCHKFKLFGLNENDYANLKWEDEPVEVFVNIED